MAATEADPPELWFEMVARRAGLNRLMARAIGRPEWGAYVLVFAITAAGVYGLGVLGALQTGIVRFIADPATNLILPTMLFLTYSARRLRDRYHGLLEDLPECDSEIVDANGHGRSTPVTRFFLQQPRNGESESIRPPAFSRLRWVTYGLTFGYYGLWIWSDPAGYAALRQLVGPKTAAFMVYGLQPLFYYPLIAELLTVIAAIHVALPVSVRSGPYIDFSDPHGYGGLKPLAELLKFSTTLYFLLLTVYVVFLGTAMIPLFAPSPLARIVAASGLGVVLFVAPVYALHTHIVRLKEAKIDCIASGMAAAGPVEDTGVPPDITPDSEHVSEYFYQHMRLSEVRSTKEYPLDVSMFEELLGLFVLPYVANRLLDFLPW